MSVTTGRASVTFQGGGDGSSSSMTSSAMEQGTAKKGASGARDVVRVIEGLGFGAKVRSHAYDTLYGRDMSSQ